MSEVSLSSINEVSVQSPILTLLGRADQVVNHMYSKRLKGLGVTNVQYQILRTVAAHPGLTQTEIVVKSGIDRSTLGNVLQRLEKRRLVRRVYRQGNSKSKRCFVTPAAITLMSEIDTLHLDIDKEIQKLIPCHHWDDFVLALRILSNVHQTGISYEGFKIPDI